MRINWDNFDIQKNDENELNFYKLFLQTELDRVDFLLKNTKKYKLIILKPKEIRNKIEAIKFIRNIITPILSLKEAKDIVDGLHGKEFIFEYPLSNLELESLSIYFEFVYDVM